MDLPTMSVRELTERVRQLVAVAFPHEVWVEGEIASLRRTARGHVFFDLVEAGSSGSPDAVVGVVLFDRARQEVNAALRQTGGAVRMTDGVHVRLRGRVDVWPGSGRVQVRMTGIDVEHTLGRLVAERTRVLQALAAEGLLDRNAQLAMPVMPLQVGVVTRVGSAAHADVLHELEVAGIGFAVTVADTAVQGPGAERSVVRSLLELERRGVDVVLVVRGGGARTDLVAFDSELVARTIAGLAVPVLTGIGHEIDTTVADAVAHAACKTPTACAASLVGRAREARGRMEAVAAELARLAPAVVDRADLRLADAAARRRRLGRTAVERAGLHLDGRARRLLHAAAQGEARATSELRRLGAAVEAGAGHHLRAADRRVAASGRELAGRSPRALERAERRLATAGALVAAADPTRALARGWSITRTVDGRLVRQPGALSAGDELVTTVAGGSVRSRVLEDGEVGP